MAEYTEAKVASREPLFVSYICNTQASTTP